MSCRDVEADTPQKRKTLWIVLWLNVAIAAGFLFLGVTADSNALLANGLDNTSDAAVYAISLFALNRARSWKRGAARLSGVLLLVFAAGIMIDAVRRFVEGSEPIGLVMMGMAAVAGIVNLICLVLLKRLENPDVNLRAATTFSFNDFISNGGILIAGLVVLMTGQNWPDLVVGFAVAAIALYGGIDILRDAHADRHNEDGTSHTPLKERLR